MSWFDRVRDLEILAVAGAVGLDVRGDRGHPCPSCGAEHRSRSDRRGPVSVDASGGTWHCFECEAGGGPLELATHRLFRSGWRELIESQQADVRAWFASRFGIADSGGGTSERTGGARARTGYQAAPKRTPKPAPPPLRPRAAEVAAVWSGCREVSQDAEVAAWLASRGLDPERVMELELAKALPADVAELPPWAALGTRERPETARSWATLGYRCLVPLYDASGALASLRARSVTGATPKAIPPTGNHLAPPIHYEVRGLVMANPVGRRLLRDGRAPSWWPGGKPLEVWIAEGETDFLAIATGWRIDDREHPAVFGIESGAWVPEIAARVPFAARVIVATDADEQGERYAAKVRETLRGRAEVRRWTVKRAKEAMANE